MRLEQTAEQVDRMVEAGAVDLQLPMEVQVVLAAWVETDTV